MAVPERRLRVAAWILAVGYGLGAPVTVFLELRDATLSQRFDVPPALIHATCAVQLVCVFAVFSRRAAPWAAAALTGITLGAVVCHLRIGSPLTAIPALAFTAVQVWFGLASRARALSAA